MCLAKKMQVHMWRCQDSSILHQPQCRYRAEGASTETKANPAAPWGSSCRAACRCISDRSSAAFNQTFRREKIYAHPTAEKALGSRVHKEHAELNNKNANNPLHGQNISADVSPKADKQPTSIRAKRGHHNWSLGNTRARSGELAPCTCGMAKRRRRLGKHAEVNCHVLLVGTGWEFLQD